MDVVSIAYLQWHSVWCGFQAVISLVMCSFETILPVQLRHKFTMTTTAPLPQFSNLQWIVELELETSGERNVRKVNKKDSSVFFIMDKSSSVTVI